MTYKLTTPVIGDTCLAVIRTDDNGVVSSIPFDPENIDYQAYLAWLAEGNTPEPAG